MRTARGLDREEGPRPAGKKIRHGNRENRMFEKFRGEKEIPNE